MRAEAELRTSQAQLSNAMTMAHLGPWEYDAIKDLFIFNDHFYKMFRTTAEQVGGYTMSSADYARRFLHPDDMHFVADEVNRSLETTDSNFSRQLEHRIVYPDGEIGHITVRFFIVKDNQGAHDQDLRGKSGHYRAKACRRGSNSTGHRHRASSRDGFLFPTPMEQLCMSIPRSSESPGTVETKRSD